MSPEWSQRLRQALTVESGWFQYPDMTIQGIFGRTTASPATPAGSSLSFSSTIRTS